MIAAKLSSKNLPSILLLSLSEKFQFPMAISGLDDEVLEIEGAEGSGLVTSELLR